MEYDFYTADVFTDQPFGGNPLAVLPAAEGLSDCRMQQIAREFNLSETVFVLPARAPGHDAALRIFTPAEELPFAGHPTLGCAHVLASIGRIPLLGEETRIVFEERVGPVPVSIWAREGRPVFTRLTAARAPELGPPPPPISQLARVLSLERADVLDGQDAPQAVSCGVPFLFVPLSSREAVRRARLDRAAWSQVLALFWASMVFVFCREPERPGSDLHGRMFAPGAGIEEDPATGAAAVALAAYLALRDPRPDGTLRWTLEQGFEMGRPSLIELEADKRGGTVAATRVGGAAVLVSRGSLHVREDR